MMGLRRLRAIAAAAVAATLVASLGATMTDLGPWYQGLTKPPWQPPDWLFGPAWTLIFTLTALAGLLAWQATANGRRRELMVAAFALNGFLNVLWSVMFFQLKRPNWALFEVAGLWLSVVLLIIVTGHQRRAAGWMLAPYLGWVTFAGVLNLAIVQMN